MTEDLRIAQDTAEPPKTGPDGSARWSDYLDWMRSELIDGVLSLPSETRRMTLVPSGWTPIELLCHVLHMEQRWFIWGFLGERVDAPWGDWNVPDPTSAPGRWTVPDDVTAEDLAARLNAVGERTRAVLRDHPITAAASTGGRFVDNPPTLEWICFHVLAEYARHAGHLDIVVEIS